ncbi:MAG: vgr related protein [Sphingomonadales bacterium]|nr:vgr related protein [Sphingomonadales bacterium]
MTTCPAGGERPLTSGEVALVQSVFGTAIDCDRVMIRRRRWFPFQPRSVTMAPRGHIHFHPRSDSYCADFSTVALSLQGHFIHEMVHVWQVQQRGAWFLVLRRPFSRRYDYSLRPGWTLSRYGIEQQAEIVRHFFLISRGLTIAGAASLESYQAILPFQSSRSMKL